MRRSGLVALMLMPLLASAAAAGVMVKTALPADDPQPLPMRPVGEPDSPPSIGLDLFEGDLSTSDTHEEAWPGWPSEPDGN